MKGKNLIGLGVGGLLLTSLCASPSLAIFDDLNLGKLVKSVDFGSLIKKKSSNENDFFNDDTLFGGDINFSTGGFNPNASSSSNSEGGGQKKFNPSYGGISLSDLTKKDRTQEDDINLFTKSANILFGKTTGRDVSPYTKILGNFLGSLSRKSAKDADDILTGQEGQDDLSLGAGSDGLGKKLSDVEDIVGAIGVLIPKKVRDAASQNGYLGEGGGVLGINKAVQTAFMTELTEVETIYQSINSLFSDEGQAVTAQLQSGFEETAAQAAVIADEAQGMKASLDVNRAMTGQLAVISTNQNATYAEAIQNRVATVQGNQLAAKLVKIENQRNWDEKIEQSSSLTGRFKVSAGFASMVDSKTYDEPPNSCAPSAPGLATALPSGSSVNSGGC